MKVAYIGLDLFYPALETLAKLGCEIVEIFTCETDNVTEFNQEICNFARENNIPCSMSRITREDIERLLKKGCQWAICGGYYYKIPADTALPLVNIHPALLPIGRGPWPMPQYILWGHKKSGVTIHKIAEGLDEGDILLQEEFELDKDETLQTFMQKANALVVEMIERLVSDFEELYQNAAPQGEGEYWKLPLEEDYTVYSSMTADEADLVLRAFLGHTCIYKAKDKSQKVLGGRAVKSDKVPKGALEIADGYIEIRKF